MDSSRNIIGANVFDQNLEYVSLLSNELVPSEYFTNNLATFCNYAAYHCDVHSISVPIILVNIAATSTETSRIWRSNVERFPLNLYSLLVAHSSFGKSKLLRLIAHSLQVISDYYPEKFKSIDSNNKGNCPVYNDATCAGIIASVNSCTRVLISEEADVLLPSIGAILPSPFINKDTPAVKSEARAELMKMFDADFHIRKLKRSVSKMNRFKHSFVGASSGGIFITALQRKSNGSQVHAFFERLMIWCLRPEPLMFVPENEKRKPELNKYPTFEEFCVILGLFENFEMSYDKDGDKTMVDFGNRYSKLAYNQTDRYLMAKMGKMIQLTHRLVGLLQVLEWTWKITSEYLQINGCFTGAISEEFLSDIRIIFNRLYGTNINDKRTYVATVTSVEHAINIIEALLEQYKVLMRLPDDNVRINSSNSNNTKPDSNEHTILNRKLEKSKLRYKEHIRDILLFKSVVFTPTTLYKSYSVFKHYSENVDSVLKELVDIGLIIPFKDGIISSTKKGMVFAKWFPKENDELECQCYEKKLAIFNDERINADSVIASTTIVSLLPYKVVLRPSVLNYLKSERYARLHPDVNTNCGVLGGSNMINAIDEDSNSSNILFEDLMNENDIASTDIFGGFKREFITSSTSKKSTNFENIRGELTYHMMPPNVTGSTKNIALKDINIADNVNGIIQDLLRNESATNVIELDRYYKCSLKRKNDQRAEDATDDENGIQRDARIRLSDDMIDH